MKSKSLAARTREAVREEPFLFDALRAGVLNYTAVARYLPVEGEHDAIATALRRYADELDEFEPAGGDVRVSMKSGIGRSEGDGTEPSEMPSGSEATPEATAGAEPLLAVGEVDFAAEGGGSTAIVGSGSVDAAVLRRVLGRLETEGIEVEAAGVTEDALVVVVERRVGANALRAVESVVKG
jgi:hypothetical protein